MTKWNELIAMAENLELDSLDKVEMGMEIEEYFVAGRHQLDPETADVVKLLQTLRANYPQEYASLMDTANPDGLSDRARANMEGLMI